MRNCRMNDGMCAENWNSYAFETNWRAIVEQGNARVAADRWNQYKTRASPGHHVEPVPTYGCDYETDHTDNGLNE